MRLLKWSPVLTLRHKQEHNNYLLGLNAEVVGGSGLSSSQIGTIRSENPTTIHHKIVSNMSFSCFLLVTMVYDVYRRKKFAQLLKFCPFYVIIMKFSHNSNTKNNKSQTKSGHKLTGNSIQSKSIKVNRNNDF